MVMQSGRHSVMLSGYLEALGQGNYQPNTVVDSFCKRGLITEAHHLPDYRIRQSLNSLTMMYEALMDVEVLKSEVLEFFTQSKLFGAFVNNRCAPDVSTYNNILIKGLQKISNER